MITESEWTMLDYFWDCKGDVTRWCGWEEFSKKPGAAALVEAIDRMNTAPQIVSLIIKGMRP